MSTKKINLDSNPINLKFFKKKVNKYYINYEYDLSNYIYEDENYFCLINGYIRNLNLNSTDLNAHFSTILSELDFNWPLNDNITGSYTICVINKKNDNIIICNDLIGLYPLFYKKNGDLFISSSIILCGAFTKSKFDKIGIAQRLNAMESSTISSRTIIKNFKRLQSGEYIKIDSNNIKIENKFDNRLYQNINNYNKKTKNEITDYYKIIKKEHEIALFPWDEVYLALSGGLDSRLTLASISNKKINCLTYGDVNDYEVKIAKRLTKIKGNTTFRNFSDYSVIFPTKKTIKSFNLNIESIVVTPLLQYLNQFKEEKEKVILLGDLSESLPARGIKTFSNRNNKIKNFIGHIILNKKIELTKSTSEKFVDWKKNTLNRELKKFKDDNLNFLNLSYSEIKREITNDYNEIFLRIEKHNLPFVELYDELFNFYTSSRGRQLPLNNSKFHALCVSMSSNLMIATTSINPEKRIYNNFFEQLFKSNEDFRSLYKIPIASTPLVSPNSPKFIKYIILGLRKNIDDLLIKRILNYKNPNLKYRLFKSFNWVKVYQNKKLEEIINSYFTPNNLDESVKENVLKKVIKRRNLNSWPIINFNEISNSMLNIEIEMIKKIKKNTN